MTKTLRERTSEQESRIWKNSLCGYGKQNNAKSKHTGNLLYKSNSTLQSF